MTSSDFQSLIKETIQELFYKDNPNRTTITRKELKEVIKETIRTILREMYMPPQKISEREQGIIPYEDLKTAWREDQDGEYIQIYPDDSAWYVVNRKPKQQIAPPGSGQKAFTYINNWLKKNRVFFNIWQINDHGNIELFSHIGKPLGGLAETLSEMTTTGAVAPINLPGNVKGGWVSKRGGSKRGIEGSRSLGYELTPIGKEDMNRKQDPV